MLLSILQDIFFVFSHVAGQSTFPQPLTKEEEAACISRMASGDPSARHELIERNLRLVAHIAKKYAKNGHDADDMVSIGTIGLIKAVNTFKPENGTQLATYAARCIDNEILMSLRAARKTRNDVYLQEPIGTDREGNEIMLVDVLPGDGESVTDTVEMRIQFQKAKALLDQVLDERERRVIEMRYGLINGIIHPQHEVARALHISRSYVSRIEKSALNKLKERLM